MKIREIKRRNELGGLRRRAKKRRKAEDKCYGEEEINQLIDEEGYK